MGEVARFFAVILVTACPRDKFTFKEQAFMGFGWTPKATVQAAVGSMVLDRAVALNLEEYIPYGVKCLTASVLSIIITAPMGAILLSTLGPKWLKKSRVDG